MSQLSETVAEKLEPAAAAELARVLDLQARWENMRGTPSGAPGFSTPDLHGRQKAYDAFRTRLAAYTAKYTAPHLPEVTLNTPERVGMWCRAARAVLRRAGAEPVEYPAHLISKAHRLADKVAVRLGKPPADREAGAATLAAAVRNLDAVVEWCDQLSGPALKIAGAPRIAGKITPAEPRAEAA
ncbi:unnamed protein product [Gemmataceae bacterium]|nr:unnamed protein product [Gemmataceae bacterium]VTU02843.1 unnamed protein product [Gemmataceae bacterium]